MEISFGSKKKVEPVMKYSEVEQGTKRPHEESCVECQKLEVVIEGLKVIVKNQEAIYNAVTALNPEAESPPSEEEIAEAVKALRSKKKGVSK